MLPEVFRAVTGTQPKPPKTGVTHLESPTEMGLATGW